MFLKRSENVKVFAISVCMFVLVVVVFIYNTFDNNLQEEPAYIVAVDNEPAPTPIVAANIDSITDAEPAPAAFMDVGVSDFPVLRIYTEEPDIDRNVWITASLYLDDTYSQNTLYGTQARIRGRGNSTWWLGDKRPFRIRFDEPVTLLDAGHYARDWTFIANHFDRSFLRSYAVFYLAEMLDTTGFVPFYRFIDVYFNGEYQGVYALSVQISEVTEGRVELDYHTDPAISEYLIELDYRVRETGTLGEDFVFINGRSYEIHYPSGSRLTYEHVGYVYDFLYTIELAIMQRDGSIFEYIDKQSFVDFYIIQELVKNVDAGWSSIFMQVRGQGDARRLYMGPVWDFDLAFGNAYYMYDRYGGYGPYGIWAAERNHWFRYLMQTPEFFAAVRYRFDYIVEAYLPQMVARVEYMASTYRDSFERNFVRWPIMGEWIWPNPIVVMEIDSFEGHVDFVIDYVNALVGFLTEYFNSREYRDWR